MSSFCLRFVLPVTALAAVVLPARQAAAQVAVIDPVNIARAVITASELARIYEQQRRLRDIWELYREALPGGAKRRYLTVEVPWRSHLPVEDPWNAYAPLRAALDNGDPRAAAYERLMQPLPRYPPSALSAMNPNARRALVTQYGAALAVDGWARFAIHGIGQNRQGGLASTRALQALQQDFTRDDREYNGSIALLQQMTGAALVAGRDRQIGNQALSYLAEASLLKQKRVRDALVWGLVTDLERRTHYAAVAQDTNRDTTRLIHSWQLR
jgi:hypothetical protein